MVISTHTGFLLVFLLQISLASAVSEYCPAYASFFGEMGIAAAMFFCSNDHLTQVIGAAYGTAKPATGIASVGVFNPNIVIKGLIPVIFAGITGIYGLIIGVMILTGIKTDNYPLQKSFTDLAAGLTMGLSGLASGMSIGVVGDIGIRSAAHQPRLFVGVVVVLAFASALGLYGLIVAMFFITKPAGNACS